MYDSTDDLKKRLLLGEDSVFETKDLRYKDNTVSFPHRNSMADELAAMANTNSGVVDEQIVCDADLQALNKDLWTRFRTPLSPLDDEEFLIKLKLIAPDENGVLHPTISGLLMASERPKEFIPSAYIQAVRYNGEQQNAEQLDAEDITGPLDKQIKDACKFVRGNMKTFAIKVPGRLETPQYSMNAVFEAITNAVAQGSKRIYIMDKRGEGVPIILIESEKLSGRKPEYLLIDDTELRLTVFAARFNPGAGS